MQSFLVNGGVKHAAEDGVVGGPGSPMSVVHYYVDHPVCVLLDIYHTLSSKVRPNLFDQSGNLAFFSVILHTSMNL